MRDLGPAEAIPFTVAETFEPFQVSCTSCGHRLLVDTPDDLTYGEPCDYSGDTRSALWVVCPNCHAELDVEYYGGRHHHPNHIVRDLLADDPYGKWALAQLRPEISFADREAAVARWRTAQQPT